MSVHEPGNNDIKSQVQGAWLAHNVGDSDFSLKASQVQSRDAETADHGEVSLDVRDPPATSRTSSRHASKESVQPPSTPPPGGLAPAPSKPARPLVLTRPSLPAGAGAAAVAARRPIGANGWSRGRAPPAALAAGAVASGKALPKLPAQALDAVNQLADKDAAHLASLATKLSQAEKLNQQQAVKLTRQNQELEALRAEVAMLRRAGDEDEVVPPSASEPQPALRITPEEHATVCAERDRLERQVEEMTRFLEDYGLTWVGDSAADAEGEEGDDACNQSSGSGAGGGACGEKSSGKSPGGRRSPQSGIDQLFLNIPTMTAKVKALNEMVERQGAKIVSSVVGGAVRARLTTESGQELPLTFFEDGVKLGELPFSGYPSKEAQLLLRDIYDGFFPYALKDSYPDGVAMRVVDRMHLAHAKWSTDHAADDPELSSDGSRLLPTGGRVLCSGTTKSSSSSKPPSKPSSNQAMHRLASAPMDRNEKPEEVSLLEANSEETPLTARIQVKLDIGLRVVFVMHPSQSVGLLRKATLDYRKRKTPLGSTRSSEDVCNDPTAVGGSQENKEAKEDDSDAVFELRSAFPPKLHDDLGLTVEEAGLTPNATLFLSKKSAA